jgi:hypothetical protein
VPLGCQFCSALDFVSAEACGRHLQRRHSAQALRVPEKNSLGEAGWTQRAYSLSTFKVLKFRMPEQQSLQTHLN